MAPDRVNPISIHAYCWLPAWSTGGGERIVPKAAEFGFFHMVAPMRDHEAIEPDRIAGMFERNGMVPMTSANQLPDANVSSSGCRGAPAWARPAPSILAAGARYGRQAYGRGA